jgi:hypothetical protein
LRAVCERLLLLAASLLPHKIIGALLGESLRLRQ